MEYEETGFEPRLREQQRSLCGFICRLIKNITISKMIQYDFTLISSWVFNDSYQLTEGGHLYSVSYIHERRIRTCFKVLLLGTCGQMSLGYLWLP